MRNNTCVSYQLPWRRDLGNNTLYFLCSFYNLTGFKRFKKVVFMVEATFLRCANKVKICSVKHLEKIYE